MVVCCAIGVCWLNLVDGFGTYDLACVLVLVVVLYCGLVVLYFVDRLVWVCCLGVVGCWIWFDLCFYLCLVELLRLV